MNKSFKLIMTILVITLLHDNCIAQIQGKIYSPGDSVVIDGIPSIVYKVDESGLHGTAMSPFARTSKEIDKLKKQFAKHYEKEIKKGNATQAELEFSLACIDSLSNIPIVPIEKAKQGKIYHVDDWSKSVPLGWRIPTIKDAEDFAVFFCGGLGKEYGKKYTFVSQASKFSSDPLIRSSLTMVVFYGIIVSDSDKPSDVRFLQRYTQRLSGKDWFEIKDTFIGKEKTVAVKDF